MEMNLAEDIKTTLEAKLGISPECSQDEFFVYINVPSENLIPLFKSLHDDIGMNYLANLTAVDHGEEFEMVYHLYSIPDNGKRLSVKTRVSRTRAEVDSIYSIYPTSDWQEREVFDLMGINFRSHPNLVRVLLPDSFAGHPLRKDFRKEAGTL